MSQTEFKPGRTGRIIFRDDRGIRITGQIGGIYRRRMKRELREENPMCRYCTMQLGFTLDHVHPVSRGGDDSRSNLVLACNTCNSLKGNRTLSEMRDELRVRLMNVEALMRRTGQPIE